MNITQDLDTYIREHTTKEPVLLRELRKETYQKMIQPHMLSGELQGRILAMISKMVQPKFVLDIGTFTGYSALCMSEGMQKDGTLITIDKNQELHYLSQKYLQKSSKNIEFIDGNALDIIPNLPYSFDLVFLDADKDFYPDYIPLLLDKTHTGSTILVDNVLWKGKLIEKNIKDKKTNALREFNSEIVNHSDLEVVILPIRDGISIIRRK